MTSLQEWEDHRILNVATLETIVNTMSKTRHFHQWNFVNELKIALHTSLNFWWKPYLIRDKMILQRMFSMSRFLLWFHESFSFKGAELFHDDILYFEDQVNCLLADLLIDRVILNRPFDFKIFLGFDMEYEARMNPELLMIDRNLELQSGQAVVGMIHAEYTLSEREDNMEEVDVNYVVVEEGGGIDDVNAVSNILSAHESHCTDYEGNFTKNCRICLEIYTLGDQLRVLLCLHYGHADCIERWLLLKPTCHECNTNLVQFQNRVIDADENNAV
jgi:hypothetical protein